MEHIKSSEKMMEKICLESQHLLDETVLELCALIMKQNNNQHKDDGGVVRERRLDHRENGMRRLKVLYFSDEDPYGGFIVLSDIL